MKTHIRSWDRDEIDVMPVSNEAADMWFILDTEAVGWRKAIVGHLLAEKLRTTERGVQSLAEELVRAGYPACASVREPKGYFVPVLLADAEEGLRTRRVKLREIARTHRALRASLRTRFGDIERREEAELDGQLDLAGLGAA